MEDPNNSVFLDEGFQRTLATGGVCVSIAIMSLFSVFLAFLFGLVSMWLIWRKEGDSLIELFRRIIDKSAETQ